MILPVMGGAGALKQVLIDSRINDEIAEALLNIPIHPLVLAWLTSAVIRVCLGSATVAGLTTAGIIAPLIKQLNVEPSLMVLAIGAGSLMFSHVNDPAFWMYKEYLNLSFKDTIRSWSLMETTVAIVGLIGVLVLAVIFVEPVRLRVFSIFADRKDSSNNFRRNVWDAVFEMIRDRPIFGIGPGHASFNKVYPLYQHPRYTALSAYSILFEVTVETGFVGLACFLWLIIVTFNTAFLQVQRMRQLKSVEGFWLIGAIAILLGMLAHGTVDTVWYRPEVNTLWWLIVALIASYWTPLSQNQTNSSNSEPTLN